LDIRLKGIELYETQQQQDIDSIVAFINRNDKVMKYLLFETHLVTDQTINSIDTTKLDLIHLSINCRNISFGYR
jgi:hypothetical protein